MKPLCANSNDTELIIVYEAQTMMKVVSKKAISFDDQLLFEYVESVLNHQTDEVSMDAPRIVPPPPPKATIIDDVVEFVEELDWKDKDLQLNVMIVCCLVGFIVICKNCGLKGAVMSIFALSIFGGMLPTMIGILQGGMPGNMGGGRRAGR